MAPAEPAAAPVLRLSGIAKQYGGVPALRGVDLSVDAGEVHGLLGQNGAGKSTLMNVVLGLVRPDRGTIEVGGQPASIASPADARAHGIAMVHQHYSLIPTLSVWENIALSTGGRIRREEIISRIAKTSERFGLDIDPGDRVAELTVGQQQRVELVKALIEAPRLLILDEPTAVLTEAEARSLFAMLGQLAADGECSVVLISHNLGEIRAVAHRATVLRGGSVVARIEPAKTSAATLARNMIGTDLPPTSELRAVVGIEPGEQSGVGTPDPGWPVLQIDAVSAEYGARRVLDEISLQVRAGEILGVAGVEGNGQKHLAEVLSGALVPRSGTVRVRERVVPVGKPGAMRAAGIGVVPEDRRISGCIPDLPVADNLALAALPALRRGPLVPRRRVLEYADRLVEEFGISLSSVAQPMRSLSGGNQQKAVLARELSTGPAVLVLAQPTRGLDVGAAAGIRRRIREAARDGVAVLLISSDLGEIRQLSDRVAVLFRGAVCGQLSREQADPERIGLLMGGVRR